MSPDLLEDLIAEFVERSDKGETLDPVAFARQHPEVENELRSALQRLCDVDALFPAQGGDTPRAIGAYSVLGPLGRGGTGHVLCVELRYG